MPPLNTYVFEHYASSQIQIIIQAYSYEEAMETLVQETKHPADYIYKS